MGISLSGLTESSTGDLTISAGSGNDVLIGEPGSTLLFIDGGTNHAGYGSVSSISGFLVNQPAETLGVNLDFRRFSVSSSFS